MSFSSSSRVLLNLGCGHVTPAGWINVDGSNRAWLASRWPFLDRTLVACRLLPPTEFANGITFANFFRRLPWPEATADAVYLGEVMEHFTLDDGVRLLKECLRVLKPGGTIRIRVPDNARFWQNYLNEYNAIKAKPRSEWTTSHSRWVQMFFQDICVRPMKPFRSMGHFHKWMYDDVSLILLLEQIGFVDVERRAFHDSRIAEIQNVEVRDDLIVESTKPTGEAR